MMTDTLVQPPVIIIGGGLSGLSAAAILARAGHTVTVFEKASAPGGAPEQSTMAHSPSTRGRMPSIWADRANSC
jgi:cation diffusion facilitator CzcD-associated flavoprotein CzcO